MTAFSKVTRAKKSLPVTAKLFRNGRSQAVRLPKEFRFEGTEVSIIRTSEGVLLQPVKKKLTSEEIRAWFARMDSFNAGEVIPGGRNQPPMQEREFWG